MTPAPGGCFVQAGCLVGFATSFFLLGNPFLPIGMGCARKASVAGELYCFAIDASFRYHDDDSQLILKVSRED